MAGDNQRILFIVSQPFFQWRGSPIRVGFDVQALAELGYTVDLLVPPFGDDRVVPGVCVHRVRHIPWVRSLPIGPSFPKLLFDCLLYLRARALLRQHDFAVLHGVEDAGAICALLAKRAKAKFVFEKHSDPRSYRNGFVRNVLMGVYAFVERRMIRSADAVIGTGPELAKYAAQVCPDKLVVEIADIPSSLEGSTPETAALARQRFVQKTTDILITYVGSFAVYQGIDLLFESISFVCASSPDARFLIIGGDPAQIAKRKQALEAAGCADRVYFAGLISPDALPAVLAGSDILLSPRIAGANTPLKILDYLKACRPIVATENAANRQILDEATAVFASPDPQSYAAAILRLIGDAALRQKLSAGGQSLIDTKYNFVNFKQELFAIYRQWREE